jgi:hypothetical protein
VIVTEGQGIPIGISVESASIHEVKLLEPTLREIVIGNGGRGRPRSKPERVIADRAYDSNAARLSLLRRGIDPIIPARRNNFRAIHQEWTGNAKIQSEVDCRTDNILDSKLSPPRCKV